MKLKNNKWQEWIQPVSEEQFKEFLETAEAFWMHSGNPQNPHVELTAGEHSDGFVDVLRALRFSNFCFAMAREMACKIRECYPGRIDWVIGSDHAGATFSQNVAIWLEAKHDFTEKGSGKEQVWKRFKIANHEVVVQIEELMTTALTFKEVRDGIRKGNDGPVTFAPVAGVLVHRSDVWDIEHTKIVPFTHYDINVYDPNSCPLCRADSRAIRPKNNWALLTAKAG